MKRIGKKTRAWLNALPILKQLFMDHDIVTCEITFDHPCTVDNFLGFAHKRRRVTLTLEELVSPQFVILACQNGHYTLDYEMNRDEAEVYMEGIIEGRNW